MYQDSKTFVDMPMKFAEETVLEHFMNLPDHAKSTLQNFLAENFDQEGTELETVDPEDWIERPQFIDTIEDEKFQQLALKMNKIWKHLTRRISKQEADIEAKSSLIFLERPFVVPGGRYTIIYTEEGMLSLSWKKVYLHVFMFSHLFVDWSF